MGYVHEFSWVVCIVTLSTLGTHATRASVSAATQPHSAWPLTVLDGLLPGAVPQAAGGEADVCAGNYCGPLHHTSQTHHNGRVGNSPMVLIPFAPPHVPYGDPMWALSTCGEANDPYGTIKLLK